MAAPLPPLALGDLASLVPSGGLRWIVLCRPAELLADETVRALLATAFDGNRYDAFAEDTGVDLRRVERAVVAGFDASTSYLVRGGFDRANVAARWRDRLVHGAAHASAREDVTRIRGDVGTTPETLLLLGAQVACFTVGGELPARAAEAYALDRLHAPRALAGPPLASLVAHFGDAPLIALAPGPFEQRWAHAARGLVGAASAVGVALAPTSGRVGLRIGLAGVPREPGDRAVRLLRAAWDDLAAGPIGGLALRGCSAPTTSIEGDVVALRSDLDAGTLGRGIAAALHLGIADIMREGSAPPGH